MIGAAGTTVRKMEEEPPVAEEGARQARQQTPKECPKCKGKHADSYCVQYYADKGDTFDREAFVKAGKRCGQCGGEHPARYHAFAKLYRQLHAIKNNSKGKDGVRTRTVGDSALAAAPPLLLEAASPPRGGAAARAAAPSVEVGASQRSSLESLTELEALLEEQHHELIARGFIPSDAATPWKQKQKERAGMRE